MILKKVLYCQWAFSKKSLFLGVYERHNKFRYIIKKGVQGKNKNIQDLWPCVIQKFNGYSILKCEIKKEEKQFHEHIDALYEPVDDRKPIIYFLTDRLHLAHRPYCSRKGWGWNSRKIKCDTMLLLW